MSIIRPRLNDYHHLSFRQDDVDFVIPFLEEDIPLFIDPFLLWKSPSQQDNSLHLSLVNSFNYLGNEYLKDNNSIIDILIACSECNEVGLGTSKTKNGKRFGKSIADKILSLYKDIPQISQSGLLHFEEIQLLVENIAEDRISDIAANFIKSFLIDYTIEHCEKFDIPMQKVSIEYLDTKTFKFVTEDVTLPTNPSSQLPILLVPKRWLRRTTYINYESFVKQYYAPKILKEGEKPDRVKILNFNRHNYDLLSTYVQTRERDKSDCKNDPLFNQIPVLSVNRKLSTILKLNTGKENNADVQYEDNLCPMLASLLYPNLDFAQEQSRTISNVSIRDLIFYNNTSEPFLKEIFETYSCKQIVFELKNVKEVNNDHVDQLNRYLKDSFGRFGIIFTRNTPPQKVLRNTVDLWSGQRKCILILTDEDLKMMCTVYASRNRTPIEVIKKKYIEFTRLLPS
jgi:hypothetical protein